MKKGQIGGSGVILGVLVMVLLVVGLLAHGFISYGTNYFLNEINSDVQNSTTITDNNTKTTVQHMTTSWPGMSDTIFGLILFFVFAFALYSAYMSDVNALILVVGVVIVIVLMVVAGILSNTWDSLDTQSTFTSYAADFPFTNFVLDNYVVVFGGMLFVMLMVAFVKSRFTGGGYA